MGPIQVPRVHFPRPPSQSPAHLQSPLTAAGTSVAGAAAVPTGWGGWAGEGSLEGGGLSTYCSTCTIVQNSWLIFNSKNYDPLPDMISQSVFKCSTNDPLPTIHTHHFSQGDKLPLPDTAVKGGLCDLLVMDVPISDSLKLMVSTSMKSCQSI